MNPSTATRRLSAIALVLAAGACVPAFAQSATNSTPPSRDTASTVASTVDFRSAKWLIDRDVANTNSETIGSVSDLIFDRGSGRIEYLVIKTGSTLGMGGRQVALPFNLFGWESGGKDRFLLSMTPEHLKKHPEYSADVWKAMKESAQDDKSPLRQKLLDNAASANDPYAGSLDTSARSRIEGTITKVDRARTTTFGEQMEITVAAANGYARRIALGPSWYVNATEAAPMRGDAVVVETLALPRDPDELLAALSIRTGERTLKFRDTDGVPVWTLKAMEAGGRNYSAPYSRYVILSSLPGMKVDCRGTECGKVYDVILDRNSGEIAFLSIDPNSNFLGIGDTKRLVPWSVAAVTLADTVRIDASIEMVKTSAETPSDLSTLNSGALADRVYKAFDVEAPKFRPSDEHAATVAPDVNNPWSGRGAIINAIQPDSQQHFSGKVIDVVEVKFDNGARPARAVRIQIQGRSGGEETVLLGPAWYLENQKPICREGDTILINAVRTTIDNRSHWLATSVDCQNTQVVLLGPKNTPAWEQP